MRAERRTWPAITFTDTKITAAEARLKSAKVRREKEGVLMPGRPAQSAFLRSTMTDRKNTASRKSITPRMIALKCVRKLNPATVPSTASGAQPLMKPKTIGEPLTVNTKHTAAVTTKAITWFLVSAERHAPIARKAPAIRKL